MISIRKFRPGAGVLCLIAGLVLSSRAGAAFDVQTSINGVTNASNIMAGGGTSQYAAGNATIFLTDSSSSGNASTANPTETINLVGSFSGSLAIQVSENLLITNPSGAGAGSTISFTELANFTLTSTGLSFDSASISGPSSLPLDGTTFTISVPGGGDILFGQTNSQAITATITTNAGTVPEPASAAMLGLGLLGVVAAGRRRRAAK